MPRPATPHGLRSCSAVEIDTLVVGAGPQALTVLARWVCDRPSRVSSVLVVDPSGSWMRAWDQQFARQEIDVLRSPGVHHPDPDEMAYLRAHHYRSRRVGQTATDWCGPLHGPLRRPATDAFARFYGDLCHRTGLDRRVLSATVVELRPVVDGSSSIRWAAMLSSGEWVVARQVVWAGNPRVRCVPEGVRGGEVIVHGDEVDVATARAGERIAVLGGGQTAGQLALGAARRGADVALVSRSPQRISDLDVDAAWLMADHLDPFRSIADAAQRRRVVEAARRGSMTAELDDALGAAAVWRLDDVGELSARPEGDGAAVGFAGAEVHVDRVWVATGSTPDLRADPVLAALAADGAPHIDGWPILDHGLQWRAGLVVIGGLAALTLGPAAGNLGGARAAAELLAAAAPGVPDHAPELSPLLGSSP